MTATACDMSWFEPKAHEVTPDKANSSALAAELAARGRAMASVRNEVVCLDCPAKIPGGRNGFPRCRRCRLKHDPPHKARPDATTLLMRLAAQRGGTR